eukprot:8914690-Pyramimonas_sp.AAC.1
MGFCVASWAGGIQHLHGAKEQSPLDPFPHLSKPQHLNLAARVFEKTDARYFLSSSKAGQWQALCHRDPSGPPHL